MKEIALTRGFSTIVDDEDFEELSKYKWFIDGSFAKRSVLISSNPKKSISVSMHRQIMGIDHGDKRAVSHIDGNNLNNQKSNLRISSPDKSIKVTQEFLKQLFDYDPNIGKLVRSTYRCGRALPGEVVGSPDGAKGYLRVGLSGKNYSLHRLIWMYVHGSWPMHQIDHINGDKTDNRLCNLREATNSQNTCNRDVRLNSGSGIKGVTLDKRTGRWRATIGIDGKRINLGFFATKAEAAQKRLEASILHGEFARETEN